MNLKSVLKILIVFLAIAMSCLFLFSCSSTKKLKQKESYKSEIVQESDSSGTAILNIDENEKEETLKKTSEVKTGYKVKVVEGKEVSIKEYDQNGKLKGETVIKGDGDVETSSEKKDTAETKKSESSKNTDSKTTSAVGKKENEKTSGKNLNLDLEKKGFSFGDYIFWFILIILIIVLIHLNNRFKWIPIFNKSKNNEK